MMNPLHTDFFSPTMAVALTAYIVGVASPGPSNMAIMATAMSQGRRQALTLAAGVWCGALVWALTAALGLSALMRSYSWALVVLKALGGIYMCFLSWKAARAALAPLPPVKAAPMAARIGWRVFASGLGMHLTNPKAIFVWLSIVALGLPPGAGTAQALQVVSVCVPVGAVVFLVYALAFSTAIARTVYARAYRWFNATLSAVFAYAGLRMLLFRTG